MKVYSTSIDPSTNKEVCNIVCCGFCNASVLAMTLCSLLGDSRGAGHCKMGWRPHNAGRESSKGSRSSHTFNVVPRGFVGILKAALNVRNSTCRRVS